jgi:hypothetical protein
VAFSKQRGCHLGGGLFPVLEVERSCRGETLAQSVCRDDGVRGRRSLIEGVDVVLLVLIHAPGENLKSSDRAVEASYVVVLLETSSLEFTACGSPMVAWWRCGASLDGIVPSFGHL